MYIAYMQGAARVHIAGRLEWSLADYFLVVSVFKLSNYQLCLEYRDERFEFCY